VGIRPASGSAPSSAPPANPFFEARPTESAATVVPKNLRRLMLPGTIGSFVIFSPQSSLSLLVQVDVINNPRWNYSQLE
jgi:hypothetical protein